MRYVFTGVLHVVNGNDGSTLVQGYTFLPTTEKVIQTWRPKSVSIRVFILFQTDSVCVIVCVFVFIFTFVFLLCLWICLCVCVCVCLSIFPVYPCACVYVYVCFGEYSVSVCVCAVNAPPPS